MKEEMKALKGVHMLEFCQWLGDNVMSFYDVGIEKFVMKAAELKGFNKLLAGRIHALSFFCSSLDFHEEADEYFPYEEDDDAQFVTTVMAFKINDHYCFYDMDDDTAREISRSVYDKLVTTMIIQCTGLQVCNDTDDDSD